MGNTDAYDAIVRFIYIAMIVCVAAWLYSNRPRK